MGQQARAVITARLPFRHRGFDATGRTRTRTPCDTAAEVVPTNGTQYIAFVSGWGNRRPASWHGPTNRGALPRGSTSGVEPATVPWFGAKEGQTTAPFRKRKNMASSKYSGQQAAGVSATAEATTGDSNPSYCFRRSSFLPAKYRPPTAPELFGFGRVGTGHQSGAVPADDYPDWAAVFLRFGFYLSI